LTDGSATTSVIADGAVTPDKISNDASEPSRILTWVDDTTDYTFDATGEATNHTIPTGVTVNVPAGKAYNYIVIYDGGIMYSWGQRSSGATAFYGAWGASLLDNATDATIQTPLIQTGTRQNWDALAGTNLWRMIYHATWPVRLTAGSHTLGINLFGYSDNTMNVVHFNYNHLQILRVF